MRVGNDIVDQVLERYSVVQNIERRLGREHKFLPYITISREPGSGGKPIAAMVAKRLGFKLYDRRLVENVSLKMKRPVEILNHVDEHSRSGIVDIVQNILNPDYVSDDEYFRNLCEVILSIAQKGGAVIVGRGANFITPKAYGLQVQVVAPYRVRVARAISHEKLNFSEARDTIRKVTADREGFVQQYFGKDIRAPKYYDLTINTTFFSVAEAAELVVKAYKSKFPDAPIKAA